MENTNKQKSLFKRQLTLIGVIASAVVVLLVCAVVLKNLGIVNIFGDDGEVTESTGKAKYDEDGDLLGIQDRPYIYDVIPLEKVSTIEIQNVDPVSGEKRSFAFYMDPIAENLILAGREMLSFDKEKLSYLYVNTCNMLSMTKVQNPSEDLSQYGLAGGISDTWFIVTTTDGEKKQVYIGDKLPTGAAYYCKSSEKPHIYVIDTMIEQCVLASPDDFIVPMLCPPIEQQAMYTIDNIKLITDGELKVNLELAPKDLYDSGSGVAFSHIMTYPGGYTVAQTVVDTILQKLCAFQGTSVVESDLFGLYNVEAGAELDEAAAEARLKEILEKYGFVKPSHEIHYTYDGKDYKVIFGNKTEDGGHYYAMNMTQMTICSVPCADVEFLDYDILKFVDKYIFQMNIDNLASIDVKTRKSHETFLLEGEKQELVVKKKSDGKAVDTKTFRQFYIDVLLVTLTGKADSYDTSNEVLSYTFTTRGGRTYEYKFYDISTTKVFFTVDGKGEFYVNRDSVNKVIGNFDMLMAGKTFMSEALGG
ncbi:MAG: DUF4340 domain-containing protein [Clostridia bacterium]|nr:DUF4340 domain-containing protein [Clostridia bacterium]